MMLRLHKARLPIYALPIRRWCFIVILTAKYTTTRRFGERSSDSAYLCYSDGQWSEHYKWEEEIEAKSDIFFLCWSSCSHMHREDSRNYIRWVAQRWEGRRNRTDQSAPINRLQLHCLSHPEENKKTQQNRCDQRYLPLNLKCIIAQGQDWPREDRDGTPNGTKVVQFLTLFGVPPDGWKLEAFAPNP